MADLVQMVNAFHIDTTTKNIAIKDRLAMATCKHNVDIKS